VEIFDLNTHRIVRCLDCHVYQNGDFDKNPPEETFDEAYYMEVQSFAFGDLKVGQDDPSFQAYLHGLDLLSRFSVSVDQLRLLDIGAAFGSFLMTASMRGWEAHGVEISEYSSRVARDSFGLRVDTGGLASLSPEKGKFHAVTMWDSIEHIKNLGTLFDEIRSRLVDNGVVLISTDNYDSLIGDVGRSIKDLLGWSWPLRRFLIPQNTVYFSPASIANFLKKSGFEIVHLEFVDYPLTKINLTIAQKFVLRYLYRKGNINSRNSQFLCIAKKV
jgi:2-polyprenyl-3-methyl-5-hydroxy-6-metoxy-1,4-benzoquinol methylase